MMTLNEVARVAHEVNRAYCASIGDMSQLPWEETPEWQKESIRQGIVAVMEGTVQTPGDSHANWLKHKESEGWIWGPVKDLENLWHPCMVPFEELPIEQQIKDHLFLGTVLALFKTPQISADGCVSVIVQDGCTYTACRLHQEDTDEMIAALRDTADELEINENTNVSWLM